METKDEERKLPRNTNNGSSTDDKDSSSIDDSASSSDAANVSESKDASPNSRNDIPKNADSGASASVNDGDVSAGNNDEVTPVSSGNEGEVSSGDKSAIVNSGDEDSRKGRNMSEETADQNNLISANVTKVYNNITKASTDKKEYRGLELSNRMKVLLISDPNTEKAVASMVVGVGTMQDPDDLLGMAHFIEHMLFMGSEKYPGENEFTKFLNDNGGSTNAETKADDTMYYFDVLPDKLDPALDIFAQFFIAPKLAEEVMSREVNAVNSEANRIQKDDGARLYQVIKLTGDPKHPYNRFTSGNKQTLSVQPREKGIDVHKEMVEFHKRWYSSSIMGLAILGKESLDELQTMAVAKFSGVVDRHVELPVAPGHPSPPGEVKRVSIVPVMELNYLLVRFPAPDSRIEYKTAPWNYISMFLNDRGPGGLMAELKNRTWCTSMEAHMDSTTRDYSHFTIAMGLTEEGFNHVDEILTLLYQYINLMKKVGPLEWYHQEHKMLLAQTFKFEKMDASSFVNRIIRNTLMFPMEDVLTAVRCISEWNPSAIADALEYLSPERMKIILVGKILDNVCQESEKYYGVKYHVQNVSDETVESWKNVGLYEQFAVPEPNEFFADDYDLVPRDDPVVAEPVIIKDTPFVRAWYMQDNEFLLPKLSVDLDINCPLTTMDPTNFHLTSLYTTLLKDSLKGFSYPAMVAGLSWTIRELSDGMMIRFSGYNSKMGVFMSRLFDKISEFKPDGDQFLVALKARLRELRNDSNKSPGTRGRKIMQNLLREKSWSPEELLATCEGITLEKLQDFIPRLLSCMYIQCMVYGNTTKEKALQLVTMIEEKYFSKNAIALSPQQLALARMIKFETGSNFRVEIDHKVHKNSCTLSFYQSGLQNTKNNVLLELLDQVISEPCFNVLRTQEQLGYVVATKVWRNNGVHGYLVLVESEYNPAYVDGRIEAFLHHMKEYIRGLSDEDFVRHRATVVAGRLEKPISTGARVTILWAEIGGQQYNFYRDQVEVQALQLITKQQLAEFFEELISPATRRKLGVHVISSDEGGAGDKENLLEAADENVEASREAGELLPVPLDNTKVVLIDNIVSFKAEQYLYPQVTRYNTNIPRLGTYKKILE